MYARHQSAERQSKAKAFKTDVIQYTIEDAIPSADYMTVDPIYPADAYLKKNINKIGNGGVWFENEVASG